MEFWNWISIPLHSIIWSQISLANSKQRSSDPWWAMVSVFLRFTHTLNLEEIQDESNCFIRIEELTGSCHWDLESPLSWRLSWWSDGKASACSAGDSGLTPGLGRSSEKEMATHSSTLAWKIPWTEEPGRLQSMGLQRVGHDWVTSLSFFICCHWNAEKRK